MASRSYKSINSIYEFYKSISPMAVRLAPNGERQCIAYFVARDMYTGAIILYK